MSLYDIDPPDYPEYLGCPVCHSPSEDIWEDIEDSDICRCKVCGINFDFAQKYFGKLFEALSEELEPPDAVH